jgi:hypothetical protein
MSEGDNDKKDTSDPFAIKSDPVFLENAVPCLDK